MLSKSPSYEIPHRTTLIHHPYHSPESLLIASCCGLCVQSLTHFVIYMFIWPFAFSSAVIATIVYTKHAFYSCDALVDTTNGDLNSLEGLRHAFPHEYPSCV